MINFVFITLPMAVILGFSIFGIYYAYENKDSLLEELSQEINKQVTGELEGLPELQGIEEFIR